MRGPLLILVVLLLHSGCATQKFVTMRSTPFSPLNQTLKLFSRSGPELTERTKMLLRRYDLLAVYEKDPEGCLAELQVLAETENASETTYAISELAFTLGQRAQQAEDTDGALDMFSLGVANAYLYLFSPRMDSLRNPYDPQFRGACDLYNASLESVLRIINDRGMLRPGGTYVLNDDTQEHTVSVRTVGGWHDDDFDRIEFCNDYDVDGLHTTNVTYGIGVPLIAVRKSHATAETAERYYPEGLSFPVTALLRVTTPLKSRPGRASRHHCVLELIDPLESNEIQMAGRVVPLQTDLSTPLAYFLDNPLFREKTDSTLGLLDPNKSQHLRGVYMLEPYDPNRIPVLMVHGLWSSPLTWMPMFNDLRSFSELRRNYQFWFYQYPTGQPFWVSATEMRGDLAELRNTVDPQHTNETLDRMVVVGHSMGGLVSRMQTVESGNDFWRILSDYPFEDVEGSPENVERLRRALFFKPNQSIRRVVTIGTPHRGSDFANDYTRWIGRKIIKLPTTLTDTGYSLARANPKLFRDSELLTTNTSIDSLSPDSPIFPVLLRAPRAPWVTYHNIIGVVPDSGFLNSFSQGGDGVVEFASAQVDGVASEIMVESRHQDIHRTARAILEVRRILDEHLKEMRQELRWAERNTHPLVTVDEARAKDSLMVQVASDVRPASFTPPTPPSKANPLEILPQSAGTATDNAFLTKRGLPEIVPAAEARSLISLPPARSPESSTRPPLAVGDFPTPPLLR